MRSLDLVSRPATLVGALVALPASGVAASFFVQHVLHVDPCSLCIVQRLAYVGCLGFGAIALALHGRSRTANVMTAAVLAAALVAFGVAAYQVWMQAFPPPVSQCSAAFAMLFDDTPLERAWHFLVDAPADCREITLRVMGLTMPQASVLLSAAIATAAARTLMLRRLALPRA